MRGEVGKPKRLRVTHWRAGKGRRIADFGGVDYQGIIKHKSAEPHLTGRRIVTGKQLDQTGESDERIP